MPEITRTVRPRTREAWRRWLDAHGARAQEIWLLLAKKHVPGRRLDYDGAVEEALCVGWIDGLTKRFDEDYQAIRFTPRRRGSVWSGPNKVRVARLVRAGRMTEAGLLHVREAKRTGEWDRPAPKAPERVPDDLAAALAAVPSADAFFAGLTPGRRRMALLWVEDAKRPETRARRIADLVVRAARGETKF